MPRRKKDMQQLSDEPNMISLERFPVSRGITLNTKLYNARGLSQSIKRGDLKVPHSRRKLTADEINKIMSLTGRKRSSRMAPGNHRTSLQLSLDFASPGSGSSIFKTYYTSQRKDRRAQKKHAHAVRAISQGIAKLLEKATRTLPDRNALQLAQETYRSAATSYQILKSGGTPSPIPIIRSTPVRTPSTELRLQELTHLTNPGYSPATSEVRRSLWTPEMGW